VVSLAPVVHLACRLALMSAERLVKALVKASHSADEIHLRLRPPCAHCILTPSQAAMLDTSDLRLVAEQSSAPPLDAPTAVLHVDSTSLNDEADAPTTPPALPAQVHTQDSAVGATIDRRSGASLATGRPRPPVVKRLKGYAHEQVLLALQRLCGLLGRHGDGHGGFACLR
jgi:hypothetical protein